MATLAVKQRGSHWFVETQEGVNVVLSAFVFKSQQTFHCFSTKERALEWIKKFTKQEITE